MTAENMTPVKGVISFYHFNQIADTVLEHDAVPMFFFVAERVFYAVDGKIDRDLYRPAHVKALYERAGKRRGEHVAGGMEVAQDIVAEI